MNTPIPRSDDPDRFESHVEPVAADTVKLETRELDFFYGKAQALYGISCLSGRTGGGGDIGQGRRKGGHVTAQAPPRPQGGRPRLVDGVATRRREAARLGEVKSGLGDLALADSRFATDQEQLPTASGHLAEGSLDGGKLPLPAMDGKHVPSMARAQYGVPGVSARVSARGQCPVQWTH